MLLRGPVPVHPELDQVTNSDEGLARLVNSAADSGPGVGVADARLRRVERTMVDLNNILSRYWKVCVSGWEITIDVKLRLRRCWIVGLSCRYIWNVLLFYDGGIALYNQSQYAWGTLIFGDLHYVTNKIWALTSCCTTKTCSVKPRSSRCFKCAW